MLKVINVIYWLWVIYLQCVIVSRINCFPRIHRFVSLSPWKTIDWGSTVSSNLQSDVSQEILICVNSAMKTTVHEGFLLLTFPDRSVLLGRDNSRCTMLLRRSWFMSRISECQNQRLVLQWMAVISVLLCKRSTLYTTSILMSHSSCSLMGVKISSLSSVGLPRFVDSQITIRNECFVCNRPIWRCVMFHLQEEFLLSAPEGLGMFVNAEGMSNRPPIQWSYPLRALAYSHPYILGLSDDVIMVYRYLV